MYDLFNETIAWYIETCPSSSTTGYYDLKGHLVDVSDIFKYVIRS